MLGLDIAYMRAEFDLSSFSRFGDMVGAHQNLNGWARDVKARDRDETFVGHKTSPRR